MALASIVDFPSDDARGRNEWTLAHAIDHQDIHDRILSLFNVNLEVRVIDPFPTADIQSWLRRHQDLHNQMNGLLGLPGKDLSSVDFDNQEQRRAWMFQNFREHDAAHVLLAI